MKKSGILALLAVMALGMSACGEKPAEPEQPAAETVEETAEAEPELSPEEKYPATVDPANIHPGSLNSDEDTSDRWYPDGDTSSEISFTLTQTSKQDDCVGLSFCQYHSLPDGTDDDMIDMPLRDGGNGHGITGEYSFMADKSVTYDRDFTFQDNFTCYDFKSGTVWKRSHPEYGCKDQAWYDNAFSGLVAYRDLSSSKYQQIVMNEDHTFVESVTGMDDMTGRWEVQASNVLMLIYDDAENGIQSVDGASLLEDGGESGSATSMNANWQQEFNISADGKVTEFGLFPQYDDDMNLTGYAAAFELTTKDQLEALAKEKEEAIAAALAAGSPYPNPEVDNIMDITLDGVNLDQDPDQVIECIEWDDKEADNYRDKVSKALRSEDWKGYVIEVHGHFESGGMKTTTADGEHSMMVMTWPVGGEKPENDRNLILKGVLWQYGTNFYIFYDMDHVTYVD